MSDTLSDWVIDAVTAAVNVDPDLPVVVFDGDVTSFLNASPEAVPARYVIFYGDPGARSAVNLAHGSDEYHFEWQLTCIGRDRRETEWLATKSRDALVDQRPDVDGLSCEVVEQLSSQPVRPDDQIPNRAVVYATAQYGLDATADAGA